MATFNTKKILYGSPSLIPTIANNIQEDFRKDGFEVVMDALSSGGYDISITKGGFFKAVLGMKTALKVTLLPQGNNISVEAGVGILGQQVIPTIISMLFFWPVLITQIWGMIKQSKLDDKALTIAENIVYANSRNYSTDFSNSQSYKFCTKCGAQNSTSANFCSGCGRPL